LGGGFGELRIDFGEGYRVYFGEDGDILVLLLGGTKATQDRDIATVYWGDYNA
jgi:putative addiction module killer protein